MTPRELKRIRMALGLTQAALAAELGVSRETLTRWETGRRRRIPEPAARLLRRLVQERPKTRRKGRGKGRVRP